MKRKPSAVMMIVVAVMMLIVSCGEDPFFHAVSIKYEDKVVKTEIVYDGDEYTLPKEVDGIPEIGGWTIDGKEYDVGDKITVTGDITITAVIGTPVVITLYDDVTTTVYVKKGETELTLPKTPERAGYDFDGWNVDGTTVKAESKVTYKEGMKIKAIWTRYYTITYNVNGGTGSIEAGKLREDSIEEGVKIAAGTGLTKDSLSFSGWNTQSDGSGTAYAVGDVYKTKADLTLYAVWASEVTVTYRYGDKSYTVTKKPSEVAAWDGTLSDGTKWTKEGNVLDGWYSEEDGKGTYYSSTSSIPNGATLYPHWVDENLVFGTVRQKTTYSVSINSDKVASVKSVTIPAVYHGEKVTEIDSFSGCTLLESVTIEEPGNIDSLKNYAFNGCEKLKGIDLSKTKITSVGTQAFCKCSLLDSVKLPSTLTTIGENAFNGCKKLTQIELPESLTTIGHQAFAGSGLVEITIPKNVTMLGYTNGYGYAFYECTDLKTVVIEGNITTLEECTFSSCTKLESVTLPESLTSIGSYAFTSCTSLKSINIPKKVTSINSLAFNKCTDLTIKMEIEQADAPASLETDSKWGATNSKVVWGVKIYRVGDVGPAGGIVFFDAGSTQTGKYIDSTGAEQTYTWRYLEARATDYVYQEIQSHEVVRNDTTFIFGFHRDSSSNSVMVVSDKTENVKIGSGRYNTTALVKAMGAQAYDSNTPDDTAKALYAAGVCDGLSEVYNGTTYDDWFLPSAKELEEMFKVSNLNLQNDTYWSSSEDTAVTAVGCNSTGVSSGEKSRTNNYYVRPIRAFL